MQNLSSDSLNGKFTEAALRVMIMTYMEKNPVGRKEESRAKLVKAIGLMIKIAWG